jgi:diguanylate cyclase (GGDEF)-like protein/PAS domain S-box-containing protein
MLHGSTTIEEARHAIFSLRKNKSDVVFYIFLSGLTLAFILVVSCIIGLWTLYRGELREAQSNLNRLALVLSAQTALAFHEIDTVTKEARLLVQQTPDSTENSLHQQLHRIFQGFLQGQALLLFGPDGKMRAHSRLYPTPAITATDREYFKVHARTSEDILFVSKPLHNRVNGHWMISISRRLSTPDGAFAGVIMAAIEMDYFNRLYHALDLPPDTRITLERDDGIVLATTPLAPARLGAKQPDSSDQDDLNAVRAVEDLPLRVTLSLPRDTALRRWHSLVLVLCPGALVAVLGLGALTAGLISRVKKDRGQAQLQQEHLEVQVRQRTEDLQDLLTFNQKIIDASPVGIAVYTNEGKCLSANDVFCRILQMDKETLLSSPLTALTALQPTRMAQAARYTLATGTTSHHQGACETPEGNTLWLDFQTVRFTRNNVHHLLFLLRDITERKHMEEELRTLAFTDSLTGVNNRRRFLDLARAELSRARRHGRPFSFFILDIDFFKDINDTYGHDQGDLVLVRLTATCLGALRDIDVFGRLGGEEFGAILVETDLEQATVIAERLRAAVAENAIDMHGSRVTITVSIGVSMWREDDDAFGDLMRRADKALYAAKDQGRNRVVTG